MTQFFVLLALNIAGLLIVFLFVRARIGKALDAEGLREKLRAEVGQLVRDLNQTTDRNITLLEDAVRSLKETIAEADRRVEVLRREYGRRAQEQAVYDRLGRLRTAGPVEVESGNVRRYSEREGSAARPEVPDPLPSESLTAERLEPENQDERETPQPSMPFITFSSNPLRSKPPLKEEVLSLNRRGISTEFIAAKLGITVAEVELIISLEEQKGLAGREDRL